MKRELKNGLYHAGAAILVLLPAAVLPPIAGFAGSAFLVCLVRETTEEQWHYHNQALEWWMVRDALASWRDFIGWTAGGLLLGAALSIAA